MRFLIDADLPRSAGELMRGYGHDPLDVRDIGLGRATDPEIAAYAQTHRVCLVSGDCDFADIRNYPPEAYAGLVVLELPRVATARFILRLIEDLLGKPEILSKLDGRLAIVEPGRVRLRPP